MSLNDDDSFEDMTARILQSAIGHTSPAAAVSSPLPRPATLTTSLSVHQEAVICLPILSSSVPAPPSVVDSFVAWQASYSGRLSISGASSTGAGWFRGCFTPGTIRLDVISSF